MRAKHLVTKKTCAMKVFFLPDASYHYSNIPELELRMRMLSQRLHGITKVIEVIQDNEYVYLIMQLMNKKTLQDLMSPISSALYLTQDELRSPAH